MNFVTSFLLLTLAVLTAGNDSDETILDVLIIGAGFAGMAAADHLIRNSPQITLKVLESSDVTGGRTRAIKFGRSDGPGEYVIETGPYWIAGLPITGTQHTCSSVMDDDECPNVSTNKVLDVAKKIGLGMVTVDPIDGISVNTISKAPMIYDSQGKNGDPTGEIRKQFMDSCECIREMLNSDLLDPGLTFREAAFQCGWNPKTELEWAVDVGATECSGAENDVEIASDMIRSDTFDLWGPSNNLVIDQNPRGYAQVLDEMVKDTIPPGDPRIVLNAHVSNIDFGSECHALSLANVTPVKVTTEDGRIFLAKEVISTIPHGVLQKNHNTLFTPALPKGIVDVLFSGEIEMRNVTRVVLQFPTVWWDNSLTRWVSAIKEANDTASADHFSRWRNMNHEMAIPGSQILFSFLGDPQSSHYEALPLEDVSLAVMKQLRRQFPNIEIPDPIDIYISRHGYDRTRYGAFIVSRSKSTGAYESAFDEPVRDCYGVPRLRWAGSALCGGFSAWTHGAMHSGVSEAAWYLYDHDLGPNPEDDANLDLCKWWMPRDEEEEEEEEEEEDLMAET